MWPFFGRITDWFQAALLEEVWCTGLRVRLESRIVEGMDHMHFRIFIFQFYEGICPKQLLFVDVNYFLMLISKFHLVAGS